MDINLAVFALIVLVIGIMLAGAFYAITRAAVKDELDERGIKGDIK